MARVDIHGNPVIEGLEGLVGIGDRKDSGKFTYYRLGSNGYITTGPAWAVERDRREEKGDVALRKYGLFSEKDIQLHKYRRILNMGGAKEFNLAQIIENGWHRKPPVDSNGHQIHFPQLEGVEVVDLKCGYCGKPLLGCRIDEDGNVVPDDINLRRHEAIAHKEIAAQEQLGRTLATALGQVQPGSQNADVLAMFAKMVGEMQERQKEQDRLMSELREQLADRAIPAADQPPAVESGPQTMARKKGKK